MTSPVADRVDLSALIKAYDVRGVVPEELNPTVARAIGAAFADVVVLPEATERTRVVLANDMRPSGPELVAAFADGLAARGVDVIRIGLASTDGLYFASGSTTTSANAAPMARATVGLSSSGTTPRTS